MQVNGPIVLCAAMGTFNRLKITITKAIVCSASKSGGSIAKKNRPVNGEYALLCNCV